ncbi:MAG: methylmalonyl-CoA epimerase [Firmicutes bacterium]|jgi:lactoylglutathione lyase/methylmalonyl-CoA/ethylmalonyl-CoA epimerase|nr:methylmalonyl-CoA epimerase [Bacillota bacterium]
MVSRLDHVGIAVKSIDQASRIYEDVLGLKVQGIEVVPEQQVRVAFIPVGDSEIELLESTNADGPIAKFIEARGEGIQHVALRVNDINEALERCRNAGLRLIDDRPRKGAGGALIAFVHPKSSNGVLLEICQR